MIHHMDARDPHPMAGAHSGHKLRRRYLGLGDDARARRGANRDGHPLPRHDAARGEAEREGDASGGRGRLHGGRPLRRMGAGKRARQ